jgi:CDP-diacylglycerol--serine O-phosphatidyltransferase
MRVVLLKSLILFVPLILSGVLHMVVVRANLLSFLKKPVHQGWFGENKTWRGVLVMPLLTIVGVTLALKIEQSSSPDYAVGFARESVVWVGLALGLAYILSELPNSFIKRRMGVEPGKLPNDKRLWFALGDQGDSAIGCVFVYWLFFGIEWPVALTFLILGTGLHLFFNVALYWVGLRKNPL